MRTKYDPNNKYDQLRKKAWAKINASSANVSESIQESTKLHSFNSVDALMEWLDRDDNEIT